MPEIEITELETRNKGRVNAMFQGQPESMRLIALLLVAALSPNEVAAALDEIRGEGTDLERKVPLLGNRPLRHFIGKTREQLTAELGSENNADVAIKALRDAGLKVSDVAASAENPAQETERHQRERDEAVARAAADNSSPNAERTFGTEQFPAAELWDLPDEQLRAVPGITAPDVAEIRRMHAAAGGKALSPSGASGASGAPPPPGPLPASHPSLNLAAKPAGPLPVPSRVAPVAGAPIKMAGALPGTVSAQSAPAPSTRPRAGNEAGK